jgi:hypothetical protein
MNIQIISEKIEYLYSVSYLTSGQASTERDHNNERDKKTF